MNFVISIRTQGWPTKTFSDYSLQTLIFINTHLMGRNEKYFADPNSFVPERWLRSSNAVKDINPFTTLPFGFGARSCVGKHTLL